MSRIRKNNQQDDLLRQMLYEYMICQLTRYENDVIQLSNNVVYRNADPLDHLEIIMAQTRLGTAEKMCADLQVIIDISRPKR